MTDAGAGALGTRGTAWKPETRLYSDGVVTGTDGAPVVVPPHSGVLRYPGTAFLDPAGAKLPGAAAATLEQAERARAWLERAALPGGDTPYADMAQVAVTDIDALTFPNGAAVAAGSPYWRYVWPRDTGFMAVALCLIGRHDDARRQLEYVAAMQEDDGGWQARYLPDGSGDVPDGRGRQLDGNGWTLWASWVWWKTGGGEPGPLMSMIDAAVRAGVDALDPVTHLPRASQDFWEMDVEEATLGSAAPLLFGLRCGRDLLAGSGDPSRAALAEQAHNAATGLSAAIDEQFGRHGYCRRVSGRGGRDASVAFLLPPFRPPSELVHVAWREAVDATTVANGGVRPGEEWTDRATAWTPQVSLHALTAAATGETAMAHRLLSWLDLRRTRLGSLPEKVTAAGTPAAVAPLGLTGATVLMALAELEGRALPVPASAEPTENNVSAPGS
ncbi:hypothetical protein [Phytoactinopolyspora mesophila]|uniref:Glycoside hydrolase family 15 n=1 Tax=Phytoactinopolyspora mesophila TaxID=2650750 RepID=A0A7K3LYK8_9ACTN|nr:hypothetical protein [Phytoactinopolyspora mesophila]NDL56106.1 hypothetical protein [Phytoactinopolyspora mesophila]